MFGAKTYNRRLSSSDVGLPARLPSQTYAQGRIDQLTLGCTALKSSVTLGKGGALKDLDIKYWYRLPNNQAVATSLFQLQADATGTLKSLTVAGRPVDLARPEAVEASLQAIRHIHEDLKESRYPNVAMAFKENDLGRHVGKNIKIVGQKVTGEADFNFSTLFNFHSAPHDTTEMALPEDLDMFKALVGLGANPLRPDMDLLAARLRTVPAYEPSSLATYDNRLSAVQNGGGNLRVHMTTHRRGDDISASSPVYRDLFRLETKGGQKPALQNLVLMGQEVRGGGHAAQARAMGAASGMINAFARQAAPVPLTHFVNYDLRASLSDPQMVAQLQGIEQPFLRISLAGNRYTKLYGPYGSDLGNSTLLMHGGVTILHDFAFKPAPDGEKSSGAIPSIQDWLPKLDIVCLTHRHIDHAGGIPYENFKGKTIMATPQVIEHVRDAMRSVHGSKAKAMMPDFIPLKSNGYHTVSKDGGKSGITILYSPNATPHSSYCTPFYYAAFATGPDNKKYIKGVYANFGDTRDEQNVADWWFKHGWLQHLKKAHPDLDDAAIPMHPTFAEWDSTSVRYQGSTPDKNEVLENMKMATGWFDGYTVLNTHLASSDNQFDIMVQSAATHGRDFTTFGKNMETTQRIQNIFGYGELNEPWAQGHQNQMRMDEIHGKRLQARLEAQAAHAPKDKEVEAFMADMKKRFAEGYAKRGKKLDAFKAGLEEDAGSKALDDFEHYVLWQKAELKGDETESAIHRLHLFRGWAATKLKKNLENRLATELTISLHKKLTGFSNNFWRYKHRRVYAANYKIDDMFDLGSLAITRASMTSARMFTDTPERMFIGLTGSQGNDVELEAQLPKFLEKRSLLNLDPRYRHTVRPINGQKTVLMITQPAIVGNEKARERLVHKAARSYGLIVVNATHDGFEIYNSHKLPAARLQTIRNDLMKRGVIYREDPIDHKLIVAGPMPLGYRGHGRRQDIARWMMRTKAEVNAPQHINDPEAAHEMEILSKSLRQGSVPLVEDFEVSVIDRFAKTPAEKVRVIGSIPAGLTILRMEHPYQKPYRPIVHRQRVVVLEPEQKTGMLAPLMAGCRSRTAITHDFGPLVSADDRDIRKTDNEKTRPGTRPALSDLMKLFGLEAWAPRPATAPVPAPGSARAKPRTIELL